MQIFVRTAASGRRHVKLALTRFEAWVLLVDDVDAAFAANQTVVAVAALQRFQRILDFHRLALVP